MARSDSHAFSERDCESCGYFVDDNGHAFCPRCGMRYPLRRNASYRNLHLGKLPGLGALGGAVVGAAVGGAAVLLQALRFDLLGLPVPVLAGAIGGAWAGFCFARKTKTVWPTALGAVCGIGATLLAGANWWLAVPAGALAGAAAGFAWFWRDLRHDHPPVQRNHQTRIRLLEKRLRDIQAKRGHFARLERKVSGKHAPSEEQGKATIHEALRALDQAQASCEDLLIVTELEIARNPLFRLTEYALNRPGEHPQAFEIALAEASRGFRELRFHLEKRHAIPPGRRRVLLAQMERDEASLNELHTHAIRREIARETQAVSALTSDVRGGDLTSLAPLLVDDEAVQLPVPPLDLFSDELDSELARLRAEHRVEDWADDADLWEEPFE